MRSECKILEEEHYWTSDKKLKFLGYGEWVEEPDIVVLEYLGYKAKIRRVFLLEPVAIEEYYFGGHLCGYVQIPEDHPYFNKDHSHSNIDAHGGLTFWDFGDFNENGYIDSKDIFWIGYDCAHAGDYVPSFELFRRTNPVMLKFREEFPLPTGFEKHSLFNLTYRNIQCNIEICCDIIDQLVLIYQIESIKDNN